MIGRVWRFVTAPFRWVPWFVWLALAAAAAWFGRNILLIVGTIIAFHPIPVPPIFQGEPETIAEAREQDLRHFNHVRRNERSMDDAMRARFDAVLADVSARAAEMTDAEFQLALARAQAVIDNGHSNASATRMVQSFPRLPIRTSWMDGELRVLRVLPGYEHLLGARVTHINNEPVLDAQMRFRDAFGGNDPFFFSFAPLLLETPAYLAAMGLGDGEAGFRFELFGGQAEEMMLTAVEVEEDALRIFSGDLPMMWRSESDNWIAFRPEGEALFLRHPERDYWMEPIAGTDIAYVNIRANFDDDSGETLADWVDRMVVELGAMSPDAIVVDQRFNGGGDLTRTAPLMQALGDIVGVDGRIYLLANGNTFSAGIVNLAMVKEAAPEQTVIVGEEIGDRLQFWAEGWWYSLPNSGFRARYSTGFYDLQNGCSGLFICHWGSLHIFPVIVDDLDVDIPAPMRFEDYAYSRDSALDTVLQIEAGRSGG